MKTGMRIATITAAGALVVRLLYGTIDRAVIRWMHRYRETPLHDVSAFVSEFGLIHWWLLAALGLWLAAKYRLHDALLAAKARFAFIAVAASGIAVIPLKFLFGKARPDKLFDENLYGFQWFVSPSAYGLHGFPSGHTTTAFTVATVLALFYPRYVLLWYAGALLVGLSRIGVLYHYPSDVVAGAMLGTVLTLALSATALFPKNNA